MNTRAQWATDVEDLYGDLTRASEYLNVAAVSHQTGLSPNTILDSLSRPEVTKQRNPLGALSRPAKRVGNAPLWSQEQVDEAKRRQREQGGRHLGGGDEPLDTIDAALSNDRGYLSTTEIADMVRNPRTGKPIHEQTVRRWARDYEDFPCAVALRAREQGHPGVPIVVYPGDEIREWLARHGQMVAESETV